MRNKSEYINNRIEKLFGKVGRRKGDFYCYGSSIAEVVNDGGGIHIVLTGRTTTDLIEKLDAINDYMNFKKYQESKSPEESI